MLTYQLVLGLGNVRWDVVFMFIKPKLIKMFTKFWDIVVREIVRIETRVARELMTISTISVLVSKLQECRITSRAPDAS